MDDPCDLHVALLVNITLMSIAWGSLLAGMPFTIQYARDQVAPEFWGIRHSSSASISTSPGSGASTSSCRRLFRSIGMPQAIRVWYRNTHGFSFSLGAAIFTVYFPPWY